MPSLRRGSCRTAKRLLTVRMILADLQSGKNNKWWAAKKKQPTKAVVSALLNDGRVRVTGLYSEKIGKTYDATVVLEDDGQYANFKLEFDQRKRRQPMKLSLVERETILLYNQAEPMAEIYTHDPRADGEAGTAGKKAPRPDHPKGRP